MFKQHQILILLISLLFIGCGNGNGPINEVAQTGLGQEMSASAIIGDEPLNTALRICYAYRTKRVEYKANYLTETFQFSVVNHLCNSGHVTVNVNGTLLQPLQSQPMIYDSTTRNLEWYSSVNTDVDGSLSGICGAIIGGHSVSNEISNTGSSKTMVVFSQNTDRDHYAVITGTRNDDGNYVITKKETFYVETENQQAPFVGQDNDIYLEENCPEGSQNELKKIEQTWKKPAV